LLDEIEKASDALWQLLLGVLDKATLTLGDNRRVDLSQTVIFLTSNLGGAEITELMEGGMGFMRPKNKPAAELDAKVERTAVEAARRKFSPEFMNRLDSVVVFHPLKREELDEVLEIACASRGDNAGTDSFGKYEQVASPGASIKKDSIRMDNASNRVAKFYFFIANAVANDSTSGLNHFR
jgi:ATP-dependent Clp protease ATP-binding subunit ClpA